MSETLRCCTKCGDSKRLDAFGRHSNGPNGLNWWCKRCNTKNAQHYAAAHQDKLRDRGSATRRGCGDDGCTIALTQRRAPTTTPRRNASKAAAASPHGDRPREAPREVAGTLGSRQRRPRWKAPAREYADMRGLPRTGQEVRPLHGIRRRAPAHRAARLHGLRRQARADAGRA